MYVTYERCSWPSLNTHKTPYCIQYSILFNEERGNTRSAAKQQKKSVEDGKHHRENEIWKWCTSYGSSGGQGRKRASRRVTDRRLTTTITGNVVPQKKRTVFSVVANNTIAASHRIGVHSLRHPRFKRRMKKQSYIQERPFFK